ncbi:MAG: NAD-dependent epimerase/dehydratase family protein [Anaerolineae bacterium]
MILVTGATGHVGNVLVKTLVSRGEEVRALVLPNDPCRSIECVNIERVEGNVLDPESLRDAMRGVEIVYHLAGIISIMPGAEDLMWRVNVEGVRNVAEAAMETGVRRLVHVSSIHAFQRMPEGVTVDESIPLALDNAAGTYDRTKAEGTLVIRQAAQTGLDAVIVHPTAIIGPEDHAGSLLGKTILGFAKRRLQLLVPGAYDFVDVRDLVDGLILAQEQGTQGHSYILSGTYATILQVKELVQKIANTTSRHIILPWRVAMGVAEIMQHIYRWAKLTPQFTPYSLRTLWENAHFTSAKARAELGFQTRPLPDTVRDILRWRHALNPA